jgi:large subunit ribosomal protein L30
MAKESTVGKLRVTLRRSTIGEKPKTRLVVAALGLNKLNSSRVLPDNPSTRGAIHKVRHLVEVTEENE